MPGAQSDMPSAQSDMHAGEVRFHCRCTAGIRTALQHKAGALEHRSTVAQPTSGSCDALLLAGGSLIRPRRAPRSSKGVDPAPSS
jgi:hypothetical protein